jgi:hypothetical protein
MKRREESGVGVGGSLFCEDDRREAAAKEERGGGWWWGSLSGEAGPRLGPLSNYIQPLDRSHDNFINSSFASSTLRHVSPQTFAPPSFFVSFFFLTLSMDLINLIHGLISQKKNNSKMIKACMTCR